MIVEMRSYALHPGKQPEFMRLMEQEGIGIERPILGDLVGFYTTEFGALNKVIHMWRYESLEDRQKRRAELAASDSWKNFVPKVLPLISHMQNELLQPASFSPI